MNLLPRTALAALLLLTAGCGAATSASPPSSPESEIAAAVEQAEGLVEEGLPEGDVVDACALLPDSEIEALIGPNSGPVPDEQIGGGGRCFWENSDTYQNVSLDIGTRGATVNGLPPLDELLCPGMLLPDDMRSCGGGSVEFVADDRQNFVQVVTADLGGDVDEQTAIRLAGLVRDQL